MTTENIIIEKDLEQEKFEKRKKLLNNFIIFGTVGFGTVFFVSLTIVMIYFFIPNENTPQIAKFYKHLGLVHFPTIVGLPLIAATSIVIVSILEIMTGSIEVKIGNFITFKGAAAPILFWVICFLSITFAVQSTWNLKYELNDSQSYIDYEEIKAKIKEEKKEELKKEQIEQKTK